jgi:CRP/FNR family transcriptional regulator
MDVIAFLQTTPLAKNLPEAQLKTLAKSASEKQCRAGQLIIGEGHGVNAVYIVVQGTVKMSKSAHDGREQTLYLLRPRELFGICAAFSDCIFPANAVTLEKSTLLVIPGKVLEDLSKKDPTILRNMLSILSDRLKESMSLIESLSLMETPKRVASFLLFSNLKKACITGAIAKLEISQRELAKMLGTTPETISRVLKKLEKEKIIQLEGKNIRILNCEALEELATG